MITCYSFFQIGYGTGLIFGIKIYRNYDTPFLLNSINDFWRRWNLTYFNFSTRGMSTFFSNSYIQYTICIFLNTIIWFGYLNVFIFFSLMMFLTFIDLIFSKFVDSEIISKSIFLRYFYKVPSLIMIVFVFGISFFMNNADKSVLVNYEGFSSVGIRTSQLVFLILSTLIFIVFNYLKKRNVLEKIKSHVSPQTYFLGMFFGVVYLIMFGSF